MHFPLPFWCFICSLKDTSYIPLFLLTQYITLCYAMATGDTRRIDSGFTERLFCTQDRAKHLTKQYIMEDTSNRGTARQRSAVNTNSIAHIRRGLVEGKLVVQDKQIGFSPFHPQITVSLQEPALWNGSPLLCTALPLPQENWASCLLGSCHGLCVSI